MIEIIIQFFVYIFVEIVFEGIILGIIRGVKWIGLICLKLITLNKGSIEDLKLKYKDSSKPYFIGFGILIGVIFMVIKGIN